MIIRLVAFTGVFCLGLFTPLWSFLLGVILYCIVFAPALEILLLGLLIDVLFGDRSATYWYLYSLFSILIVIAVSYVRPYIRF